MILFYNLFVFLLYCQGVAAVEEAEGGGFEDVRDLNSVAVFKVGDGAGELYDSAERPGRQPHLLNHPLKNLFALG